MDVNHTMSYPLVAPWKHAPKVNPSAAFSVRSELIQYVISIGCRYMLNPTSFMQTGDKRCLLW